MDGFAKVLHIVNEESVMKVLIYGGAKPGARESALVRICAEHPKVSGVYVFGDNAGVRDMSKVTTVLYIGNVNDVVPFCKAKNIELVIFGPEGPLAAGAVDLLRKNGIKCFGPTGETAKLEASKSYGYEFCVRNGVPMAQSTTHDDIDSAWNALNERPQHDRVVIKLDGLEGGKGVTIHNNCTKARDRIAEIYGERPSAKVVLQDYLPDNPDMLRAEISVHVVIGLNYSYRILAPVQDYKPRFNNDKGLMTGGMGCFGPVPGIDMERIEREIIIPTIAGLKAEGLEYGGVLYFGLKLCPDGTFVVEFNVRFGDPEMVILSELYGSGLFPLMLAAANHEDVSKLPCQAWDGAAVGVVIVNEAYPGKGSACIFPNALMKNNVYHAATQQCDEEVIADGGRIAVVTRKRPTIERAREAVYRQLDGLKLPGLDYRKDIAAGW